MKKFLSALIIFCLVFNTMSVYAAPLESISVECQKISEPELQRELNNIIGEAFENKKIDFHSMVNKEWKILKLDQKLDLFTEKTIESLPDSEKIDGLNPDIDPDHFITPKNLTGSLILIGSVISKQVANGIVKRVLLQVGERVLGRLGASVVPFVGEFIGGWLLISDLVNSRNGALPEIQKQLKQLK